jgi:riboflavin kinase/FMN adenylyltransferase
MTYIIAQNPVVTGPVQHGRKLGRTMGFPTANIGLGHVGSLKFGVYAALARFADGRCLRGAANVGVNPTVGEVDPLLEVFLFDFDEDIYDQVLSVELVAFLRAEQKFESLATLCDQIHADVTAVKMVFTELAAQDQDAFDGSMPWADVILIPANDSDVRRWPRTASG